MMNWFRRKLARGSQSATPPADGGQVQLPTIKKQADQHVKAGRYADAERCYREVLETDSEYPGSLVMLGFVLKELGRPNEARGILERAVHIAADDADGHYLLASILATTGPRHLEISHLRNAIDLRPNFEPARRQLIVALLESDRFPEAMELCDQSLACIPNSAELHVTHSSLLVRAGQAEAAILSCGRALSLNPELIAAQQSLSRLLLDTEQLERAEMSYRREIQLTPDHFGPYHMLGVVLSRMGRHGDAIDQFKRALSLNPASSASHASLAASYMDLDDSSEESLRLARESLKKAVALEPENSVYLCNLGFNYWHGAQLDRALESFDKAIRADPNDVKARWARVMLWAPAFQSSADETWDRSGFARELAAFDDWWIRSESDGATFVGELQPFFLAYQEENNRALLERYGAICARAMRRWLDRQETGVSVRPIEGRVRLGLVSADIRLHSIWMALIKGWLLSLDPKRFELVVFSLASRSDGETAWARQKADILISGLKGPSEWVAAIREQNCEILLYPGIGLDPMTLKLASLRLAPVQINSWGHPDTSGLPTIDYYVSAECFEPPAAQHHYSEKLVLLPQLGNRIQPLDLAGSDPGFTELNIDLQRPILVCAGTPYKYQPEHDHIFCDIARRLPKVQFVFCFRAGALAKILKTRITREFEAAGLDVGNHLRFIRWLNFEEFHCLLRHATVLLDTIGFSGYNTAVQAMECGIPLVTREGRFLRGRLASGVLRRMDLQELIVQNKPDYVDLVARLATDSAYHAHIRHEIERRRSVLFDDQSAMGPFQDFLESIARPASSAEPVQFHQAPHFAK